MTVNQVNTVRPSLSEQMTEIKTTLMQVVGLRNNPDVNLSTVRRVIESLEEDFRQNVLNVMRSGAPSAELKQQARALKKDLLDAKALKLDPNPEPDVQASWLKFTLLQAQSKKLAAGAIVYPRFLADFQNICADATMCTAAFLLNQDHFVAQSALRPDGNNSVDLFECAQLIDPSWKPDMHMVLEKSLFRSLNSTQIYIARNGENGGRGHFTVWFNAEGNWYQSQDSQVELLQLTERGDITTEAQQYFADQSDGVSWGSGFGEFGIQTLVVDADIFSLLSEAFLRMRANQHSDQAQ